LLARDDRRVSIVTAAAAAFARAGYAATSMDDVAAETGVTRLILYRHFRSKDDLYRAVLQRVSARLAEEFRRDVSEHRGLTTGAHAMLLVAREDPAGFRLLWRHAAREPEFAAYAAEQERLAIGAAESLLASIPERWVPRALVAWLVASVLAWIDDGEPSEDDRFLGLVSSGIGGMLDAWRPAARR
jgi:AcrR family transcriptional regulator